MLITQCIGPLSKKQQTKKSVEIALHGTQNSFKRAKIHCADKKTYCDF